VSEGVEVTARRSSEDRDQIGRAPLGDLADGRDPPLVELAGGGRPDAPEALHRKRMQERQLPAGRNHEQAVGLGRAARHLRNELRPRNPDRDRQSHPLANVTPKPDRDLPGRARDPLQAADVEEGLLHR
jgi:hypothetical protein